MRKAWVGVIAVVAVAAAVALLWMRSEPPIEEDAIKIALTAAAVNGGPVAHAEPHGPILPDGEWEAERIARMLRVGDLLFEDGPLSSEPQPWDSLVASGLAGSADASIRIALLLQECEREAVDLPVCEQLAETGQTDPTIWIERAVATGDLRAKRFYFFLQAANRDRFNDEAWAAVEIAGRHHLERARDAGDIEAFAMIAYYQAGVLEDSPYPVDFRGALAHAYAGAAARRALVAQRDAAGFYESDERRNSDIARARRLENLADEYATLIPSQVDDAKVIARMLLERCCS